MRVPEAHAASGGMPGPVAVPRQGHSRNSSLDMRHNPPPPLVAQGLFQLLLTILSSAVD